ncbi:type 1 fimbrial major subunit FimA [Escherichia coli]|uniref:type 1 fimbrial major subunit FimA n=9 Tax=Escherichia coli TaxID=562 RepID=UPI0021C0D5A4|nr:type 1 fimbrial major subunit FimA [Escherichia coli]MCT9708912.1 type 1 fimbrial major subunit FimA [Escherichia coli]
MKLKHVGIIVVSVLAMSSAAVSAAEGDESVTTTVNGGVIHFKGEVVNAACAIDSESMNQTVELGQVRSSRLAKAGDLSSAVGFNIKLNDCDTNVSSNAAVAFLGTTVTSNDDTLALQSSAAGSAQNVGIQILDRTGEVLVLDGATFSAKTDLIDGTNILPFQARYAAVALGATRVIYPANQKQVLLPVTNNDPASVYLIQSWIENAGDQKDTQFVITPPLFSMQGKKENTLRIINATNHQLPGDRESLFWVNVKAIPAMEKDQKNENTLQLAIISRIKMFYRPTHLAMAPEEAPAMLRFRRSGSILTLINPTPYFITVTNMKAGNSNLPNTMVPPKGEVSVDIPHAVTGDISFQTINDYGALTPRIKATMQ